jgi:hypothetical protein
MMRPLAVGFVPQAQLPRVSTLRRLDHLVRDSNENHDKYWIMPLAW